MWSLDEERPPRRRERREHREDREVPEHGREEEPGGTPRPGAWSAMPNGAVANGTVANSAVANSAAPSSGRTGGGGREGVRLVGGDARLRAEVETAVLAAGCRLAGAELHGDDALPLLWAVEHPDPPGHAVLVGCGPEAWALAAAHPALQLAVLPEAAAWLGARIAGVGRVGRILRVGALDAAAGSRRVVAALAGQAARAGMRVAVLDVDPRAPRADAAGEDTAGGRAREGEAPGGAVASGGAPGRPHRSGPDSGGGQPGWSAAARWAADGSRTGLAEILPRRHGAAWLSWAPHEDAVEPPEEDVSRVAAALAATHELVIVSCGDLSWPEAHARGAAQEVLVCITEGAPRPPHAYPPGVRAALAVLRGRGRAPDGPRTAAELGMAWAGSARDGLGARPGRALDALAAKVWVPRLRAGLALGVS